MNSFGATFETRAVASVPASLNFNWTSPAGTRSIRKLPDVSTTAERSVPTTATVRPADCVERVTVPAIVAPAPEGEVGLPVQPVSAESARHSEANRARDAVNMITLQ